VVYGDVTAADGAAHLVADSAAALGGLDALVYTASGPFTPSSPQELSEADWDSSFGVVAKGFFLTARAVHDVFAPPAGREVEAATTKSATRGVIVALTDPLADKPSAAFTAHAAAKAAQVSLVKSLGVAWAAEGVRVCGIAPGPVDLKDDPRRAAALRAAERAALKRLVKPEEVGQAVRFCIENDYLNGANVTLDGGLPPVWTGVIES
jgi:NAD(P)-dependent dehydrogenase (short-subunit alcohol dehydrogenase family)